MSCRCSQIRKRKFPFHCSCGRTWYSDEIFSTDCKPCSHRGQSIGYHDCSGGAYRTVYRCNLDGIVCGDRVLTEKHFPVVVHLTSKPVLLDANQYRSCPDCSSRNAHS